MKLADTPLPPEIWAATPSAAQALIVTLQERIRDLEARLGQNSSNSSRPPSTDPPQAPPRPKAPPSGRKRGGQPGHRGAYRLLAVVASRGLVSGPRRGAGSDEQGVGDRRAVHRLTGVQRGPDEHLTGQLGGGQQR